MALIKFTAAGLNDTGIIAGNSQVFNLRGRKDKKGFLHAIKLLCGVVILINFE